MLDLEERIDKPEKLTIPVLVDPAVMRAARHIYRIYTEIHPNPKNTPIGVAIDRETHRGQVCSGTKPILLPGECFIPLNQL